MTWNNCADRFIKLSAVLLMLFLFFSCSYPKACYDNLSGIYSAQNGKYGKALAYFGRASLSVKSGQKEGVDRYLDFNIASVYREIGETDSAENKLKSIVHGGDKSLEFRINYELGSISYARGDYENAAGFFKNAVLIDNSDIKLIRNLELSLLMLKEESGKKAGSKTAFSESNPDADGDGKNKGHIKKESTDKLLDFMFSGEVPFWQDAAGEESAKKKDW